MAQAAMGLKLLYKQKTLPIYRKRSILFGAEGRTRTGTSVNPLDFESSASANSATSARLVSNPLDFESSASANSATSARLVSVYHGTLIIIPRAKEFVNKF